jgi:hypothetical protein
MKIQILFKDNPTPLILDVERKIYDEIIKGVRGKTGAAFLWAEDDNNLSTFLLRTESVVAVSILDPTEKEEEEEAEPEPEKKPYNAVEAMHSLIKPFSVKDLLENGDKKSLKPHSDE